MMSYANSCGALIFLGCDLGLRDLVRSPCVISPWAALPDSSHHSHLPRLVSGSGRPHHCSSGMLFSSDPRWPSQSSSLRKLHSSRKRGHSSVRRGVWARQTRGPQPPLRPRLLLSGTSKAAQSLLRTQLPPLSSVMRCRAPGGGGQSSSVSAGLPCRPAGLPVLVWTQERCASRSRELPSASRVRACDTIFSQTCNTCKFRF